MANAMNDKLKANAEEIVKRHGVSFTDAYRVTEIIWSEARRSLLSVIGSYGDEGWQQLTFSERSQVCTEVVKQLLDKKKIEELIHGNRKTLM